jgi:mRNA-degrading endonuclease RelE of RelBE toxin-antitoxin system
VTERAKPYTVILSPGAIRALSERLPLSVAEAVLALLGGPLSAQPHRLGKPLGGHLQGVWAARAGTFRVLYRIDDDLRTLRVERIDHRSDAYRS